MSRRGSRAGLQFAVGSAAMLAAFPPLGWWPLIVVGPMALTALAAEAPSGGRAFRRLWLFGLLFFAVTNAWLAESHWINWVLVGLASSLYLGLYGWMAWRVLSRGASPLVLPVLWTAHEMVRLCWPLNGYPWQFVGHAVAASPVLVQAADLGGVLGLSFLVTTVSGGLMARLQGRRGGGLAIATLAFLFVYGLVRPAMLPAPEPGPLLAAVQPGFEQKLKDNPLASDARLDALLQGSVDAFRAAAPRPPDLLVWPETIWPYLIRDGIRDGDRDGDPERAADDGPDDQDVVALIVSRLLALAPGRQHMLVGALVEDRGSGRRANAALLLDEDGRRLARYDKVELVPGGETLPWIGSLPEGLAAWLRRTVRDMAGYIPDLEPGPGPALMELEGRPFGVTICYENAYGDFCRRFVRQGARFLVNISNEGWFGSSTEFDHMELQSVLRAVETRRPLFRATNTGISCLVRPDGRRPEGADRLEVDGKDRAVGGVLVAEVPLVPVASAGLSPYVRWGDWPGWAALLGAALLLLRKGPRLS